VYKVAVLLATFNGIKWLKQQLDSIVAQEGVEIVIYVSDDNSNDGTLSLLQQAALSCPIDILPQGSRFGSASSNFFRLLRDVDFDGVDYVFLADQDDLWLPQKIDAAVTSMEQHDVQCYASNLVCTYASGERKLLKKDYPQTANDFLFQGASAGCTYGLNAAAARSVQAMARAHAPDAFLHSSHDWIIYAVTRANGFRWFIDGRSFIDYRQHPDNAWGALGFKSYVKRWQLLRNGWYRTQIVQVAALCTLRPEQRLIIDRIKRWRMSDRLKLATMAASFRRRPSEKLVTACMILVGAF
jgi:rhamnosyltransferase